MNDDDFKESLSSIAKAIRDEQLASKSHEEIITNNSSKSIEINAIDNERFFKKIFSFSKPKNQRKQLYLWKNKLDLLDSEIKNLEYSKSIIIEPGQDSVVHVDKLSFEIARLTIVFLFAAIPSSALILFDIDFISKNLLVLTITLALLALGIWHLYKSAIKPAKILMKRGIHPGEKVKLHSKNKADTPSKNNENVISFNKK